MHRWPALNSHWIEDFFWMVAVQVLDYLSSPSSTEKSAREPVVASLMYVIASFKSWHVVKWSLSRLPWCCCSIPEADIHTNCQYFYNSSTLTFTLLVVIVWLDKCQILLRFFPWSCQLSRSGHHHITRDRQFVQIWCQYLLSLSSHESTQASYDSEVNFLPVSLPSKKTNNLKT